MPAGRWWSLGCSLKVNNLCLYGMFFKMRKATCLSRWELELSRGVIRKDISSLRDVFRHPDDKGLEGRVATAGVSSVVMCKVFLPEQTGESCAIDVFLLVYLHAESSLTEAKVTDISFVPGKRGAPGVLAYPYADPCSFPWCSLPSLFFVAGG